MNQTLIIGSTVLDIILEVDRLPSTTDDCHINHQSMALGGCAYNVHNILRRFNLPSLFCSPVGTGIYGQYVAQELKTHGIEPFVTVTDRDNGCCYCYVEPHGERTFLSYHGAEYTFKKSWLDQIPVNEYNRVYICGLEIEEPTGIAIIEFLESHPHLEIFFAPGPRFPLIDPVKIQRLMALSPILHLNRDEILAYTQEKTLEEASSALFAHNHKEIIITDGPHGAYLFDGEELTLIYGVKTEVVDTIGAGDAHVGALIACRQKGYDYKKSLEIANKIGAQVVATKGATLSTANFSLAMKTLDSCPQIAEKKLIRASFNRNNLIN